MELLRFGDGEEEGAGVTEDSSQMGDKQQCDACGFYYPREEIERLKIQSWASYVWKKITQAEGFVKRLPRRGRNSNVCTNCADIQRHETKIRVRISRNRRATIGMRAVKRSSICTTRFVFVLYCLCILI